MDHLSLSEVAQSALDAPSDQGLRVPCYCEENAYRLVTRKLTQLGSKAAAVTGPSYFVVFVSNESKCVPMFHQLASKTPTSACLWDYHVIVVQSHGSDDGPQILDIDSRLPYPCPLDMYVHCTFPKDVPSNYAPLFRVVRAEAYLKHFSSDRSHMRNEDGTWIAPPPTYECILRAGSSNLDQYRNMIWKKSDPIDEHSLDTPYGTVLNRDQFLDLVRSVCKDATQGGNERRFGTSADCS
ncbi:N-terminal glutamine amidase [Fragilaria crotonensis]|nr:N-terminal glutamine amidase [Fragilaria crotonensis]